MRCSRGRSDPRRSANPSPFPNQLLPRRPVVDSRAEPPVAQPFPPAVAETLQSLPPPAEDIWVRIRKGYAMPDLEDPLVAKWEEWYASRPDYVARMIDRSRRYLYHIVIEVEERHMPTRNRASADDRERLQPERALDESCIGHLAVHSVDRHPLRAEAEFLVRLAPRRDRGHRRRADLPHQTHGDFNDWQLALAAYNWGEGNVAKAIAFNQKKGLPADYASLKMPDETRNYLPKLQAVKNLISDPAKYGIVLDDIPDAPYFAVVHTTKKMDVKRAAELAEMPLEEFQFLNPHYNRPVIAGADQYTLLLPIDKAELFAAKLDLDRPAARVLAGLPDAQRRDAARRWPRNSRYRSNRCARSTASARRPRCLPATRCSCLRHARARKRNRGSRRRCSRPCRRAARSTIA